jgi:ribosomal protein L16 Arg81 hydroxylase
MDHLDLKELLSPVTIGEFIGAHFGRAPLHLARGNAEYYTKLFSLDDVDNFLRIVRPIYTKAFAIDSRRKIEIAEYSNSDGIVDPLRLFELYDNGATIVLKEIEGHCPRLEALCRSAEKHFNFPFVATVFLAPPQGQCFPIHFDAKDIFVAQISGSKNWRLYQPQYELPLAHQHCYDGMTEEGFLEEIELQAGDFLYFPRGFPHLVRATDQASLHISFSTFPLTWADLMKRTLSDICEREPLFRRSLPPGFVESDAGLQDSFATLVARFAACAELHPALEAARREFVASRAAPSEAPSQRRREASALTLDSMVEPQLDVVRLIRTEGSVVRLIGLGKEIAFDQGVCEALAFALQTPQYKISDTPGALTPEQKLELFQTLVLHGFIVPTRGA